MKKKNILIIDDSKILLQSMKEFLILQKFDVSTAIDAEEAISLIHCKKYNIIICDIILPGINGLELFQIIKKTIDYKIILILMTGHIDVTYTIKAIKIGVDNFILKPVDLFNLLDILQKEIKKSEFKITYSGLEKFVDLYKINFKFQASDFLLKNISEIIISTIRQINLLTPEIYNPVVTCIDEMINNAFIHGTFKITDKHREINKNSLINFIKEKLKEKDIRDKNVYFSIEYLYDKKIIILEVEDEGKGFDYSIIEDKADKMLSLTNTSGRGLFLIKILSDSIEFSKNGSKIRVIKKL